MEPYNDPRFVPSSESSILPISESSPIPCIVCVDNLTPIMVANKENCQTSRMILFVFCETDDWIPNSYCKQSCFSIDLGDVDCCPITENPSPILYDIPRESLPKTQVL